MRVDTEACGYARVSKSDPDDRNFETRLRGLANHGFRQGLISSDVMTGRLMSRPGWDELMVRVGQNDTIVVVWLDRLGRNFDEGVSVQEECNDWSGRVVCDCPEPCACYAVGKL